MIQSLTVYEQLIFHKYKFKIPCNSAPILKHAGLLLTGYLKNFCENLREIFQ